MNHLKIRKTLKIALFLTVQFLDLREKKLFCPWIRIRGSAYFWGFVIQEVKLLRIPRIRNLKHWFKMSCLLEGIGNVSEAAEFNFHADPEAASIVLRLTRCPTYIASWELCLKYTSINMKWRSEVGNILKLFIVYFLSCFCCKIDKYFAIYHKKRCLPI